MTFALIMLAAVLSAAVLVWLLMVGVPKFIDVDPE